MIRTSKLILLIAVIFFSLGANAQMIGSWKVYRAYQEASVVVETKDLVYGLYDGSLLSYDSEYKEIKTYSFDDGMSDIGISLMSYSKEHDALILVYENSNIDIVYSWNNIVNLPSIKDNIFIMYKTINDIVIDGNLAYLATEYGIEVLDLAKKEIKETYRLDINTKSVSRWGDYLYAATVEGMKKGLLSSNLIDKDSWSFLTKEEFPYMADEKRITKLRNYNDNLIIYGQGRVSYQTQVNEIKTLFYGICHQVKEVNKELVFITNDGLRFYPSLEDDYSFLKIEGALDIACNNSSKTYWLAMGNKGLNAVKKEEGKETPTYITSGIKINSPAKNLAFSLTFDQDKLLVTGGGREADRFWNKGYLMVFEDGKWFNFDPDSISKETGIECFDFMRAIIDPQDRNHYYVSSWGEGVYEFKDNLLINRYALGNSSLASALPNSEKRDQFVRVDGMVFDKNKNLYMANGGVSEGLVVMSSKAAWDSYYYEPLYDNQVNHILIDKNGLKWFNLWRASNAGIMVLDDKSTNTTNDDVVYFAKRFVDQNGTDIGAGYYLCMTEDLNGTIWIGTDNGPILLSRADDVYNARCRRPVLKDEYGDEGVNYYLLEGQRVSAIAIDGGNRKWIGTEGGGLFLVDDNNGDIYVENFTTSNSSIISDIVNSIAINHKTGEVFIGTPKGLVSYMSDAMEPQPDYSDVLAFPNPVYPDRQNRVIISGLMGDSDVKITDMNGNIIRQGTSIGGQYSWDCTDLRGEIVKAGIYLVFAAQSDSSDGMVTKIMVIR